MRDTAPHPATSAATPILFRGEEMCLDDAALVARAAEAIATGTVTLRRSRSGAYARVDVVDREAEVRLGGGRCLLWLGGDTAAHHATLSDGGADAASLPGAIALIDALYARLADQGIAADSFVPAL